jgi:hypothetical protein
MDAIIVPCTRQKIWDTSPNAGPTQARDAYTGSAFRRWRAYAEDTGLPWFILSTKYGLTPPDLPITNYNVTISEAESDPTFQQTLRSQVRDLRIDECEQVRVLDWERFQALVQQALGAARTRVVLHRILY